MSSGRIITLTRKKMSTCAFETHSSARATRWTPVQLGLHAWQQWRTACLGLFNDLRKPTCGFLF